MDEKYFPPKLNESRFHCPHCTVFASQIWADTLTNSSNGGGYISIPNCKNSLCSHCDNYTIWIDEIMIYPDSVNVPNPNDDLGEDIKKDYMEASSILEKSPKGSAALLRLALQKLCIQLGEKGNKLNEDIANLVKKGLSSQIQQSLDILRVIGNHAVHPGQIDLNDDRKIAVALFSLINLIADTMISQPKRIQEIYGGLPQEERDKIGQRDSGDSQKC